MGVVENPDAHAQPFALINDERQVGPPAVTAEVRVRAGLQTHLMNVRCRNGLEVLRKRLVGLAPQPEEGEDVVLVGSAQYLR